MPVKPISSNELHSVCPAEQFDFQSTAELTTAGTIFGQPRGLRAIEFGINIASKGYNIYILGETGTGRTTAIRRFLRQKTSHATVPEDRIYVHNFSTPYQPTAISLPAGQGTQFCKRMEQMVTCLQEDLTEVFSDDAYQDEILRLAERLKIKQDLLVRSLDKRAREEGFTVLKTAAGMTIAPMVEDELMTEEQYDEMSAEDRKKLNARRETLNDSLDEALRRVRELQQQSRVDMRALDRRVAEAAIAHHFTGMDEIYTTHETISRYLQAVHDDVLAHLDDFRPNGEERLPDAGDLRRYRINVLVDNSRTEAAPVVIETNPTYHNLLGRIEYEMVQGVMSTHFTHIKGGSLHHANGGYLVIEARDIFEQPMAWEALKRAVKWEKIVLQPTNTLDGSNILAGSLNPEPIPLNVKIILLGSARLYYMLYDREQDFRGLFKVKADFDSVMPRTPENENAYASLIANICHEEHLLHFDPYAVARMVEFGSWLADDQGKLSARFGEVADLIREASFFAFQNGQAIVSAEDVHTALDERRRRANKIEQNMEENIEQNIIMISTSGTKTGQINGLTVLDIGDYTFGQPARITAQTYMGDQGVVHIERETNMSGPLHNKGVLTLSGYLGGKYAQNHPLSLSASLTFEQNYGGVDGDSAGSAELYALLSSLSGIPIDQGIAVTGSINQYGEIQPIGGVNEKIGGFFHVCKRKGLTGKQGVIIPIANKVNLLLSKPVLKAVADGQFRIWAIRTIDEGIELLTGIAAGEIDENGNYPEGSVHDRVAARLLHFHKKSNDDCDCEDDEDSEDEEGKAEEKSPPS